MRVTAFSSIIGPRSVARSSGSPSLNRLDRVDQLVPELLVHLFEDEDALHRDADLTRVGKRADADPIDGEIEIGVGIDDHAGVAAELENDLLHASAALHLPADIGRPGEGEELEAWVLDQGVADFAVHRHDADRPWAPRTPSTISAKRSMVSGSRDGGLRTIVLPEAMAGAILWRARLSGKLNGEMPAIGPMGNRRTMPERPFEARQQVERDDLALDPLRFLGGGLEGEDAAVGFDFGVTDRLAGFGGDHARDFVATLFEAGGHRLEQRDPLVGRRLARDLEGARSAATIACSS